MKRFQVIQWSADMKRGYRNAKGLMTREKQDQIFAKNAMLRQKIAGCLIAIAALAIWFCLTAYDVIQIWWGVELFPLMIVGFWLMLTSRNIRKEMKEL